MPPKEIENFVDYLKAVLGFMMDMANKAHLHENDWHRTVFIDGKGVGTTDFNLSPDKVEELISSGETGTNDYFHWFEAQEENPKNRI